MEVYNLDPWNTSLLESYKCAPPKLYNLVTIHYCLYLQTIFDLRFNQSEDQAHPLTRDNSAKLIGVFIGIL